MLVHTSVKLEIIDDPKVCIGRTPMGKPFLKITTPDGIEINITTNVGEMIGGASRGARLRHEDGKASQ